MAYAPAQVIDAPPRISNPYGIFSVVSFAEAVSERWENGVTWESLTCSAPGIVVGDCEDPEGFPKVFQDSGIGEADAFTVYGTYQCSPIGMALGDAQDNAREVLLVGEEKAVESRFWDSIAANPDAVTLTTGPDPVEALASLERSLADNYGSLGTIHVSRAAGITLASHHVIYRQGSQMFTEVGTPVVVGTGYPGTGEDGAAPAAGNEYIAATPGLFGYRSDIFEGSGRAGDLLDRGRNDLYGIAERNYLVGYDPCGVAFVEISLFSGDIP
jgi:hypothetical protein